jgi:hypothetical protein
VPGAALGVEGLLVGVAGASLLAGALGGGICLRSYTIELDDGWPESEKDVFQAALRMVVVKDSR